jgi:methyl-accepting chemotaxis protein
MAEIAALTQEMSVSSNSLGAAMDRVSAVVEANTAASDQMLVGAHAASQAMKNIAGISQENGLAVEEVSAGAEEVKVQVEEVSISANTLTEMSLALRRVVEQFNVEKQPADDPAHGTGGETPWEEREREAAFA